MIFSEEKNQKTFVFLYQYFRGAKSQTNALLLCPVAVFLVFASWTVAKGLLPIFQADEMYFWLATYRGGFARRALIGTLLSPIVGDANPGRMHMIGAAISLAALLAVIALVAVTLRRDFHKSGAVQASVVAALLGGSPLLGLVAFHVGYPDGLVACLVLVVGRSLRSKSAAASAFMLLVCGLVHTMSVLILLPLVCLATCLREDWTRRARLILAAAALCACYLPFAGNSTDPGLLAHLISAGLSREDATYQTVTYLHQSLAGVLLKMLHTWMDHPVNGAIGVLYGSLPAVCILSIYNAGIRVRISAVAQTLRQRRVILLLYWAAGLAPIFLLLVAWDLSRISSFAIVSAFVAAGFGEKRSTPQPHPRLLMISATVAIVFALAPIQSLYFDYARPLKTHLVAKLCTACVSISNAADAYYNRELPRERQLQLATDPIYGDEPKNVRAGLLRTRIRP